MDISTFYALFSATCFTLLGLWWNVLQLNTAWGEVMAYTSLITIPVLIVFLVFERAFVSSIAASGVKG